MKTLRRLLHITRVLITHGLAQIVAGGRKVAVEVERVLEVFRPDGPPGSRAPARAGRDVLEYLPTSTNLLVLPGDVVGSMDCGIRGVLSRHSRRYLGCD